MTEKYAFPCGTEHLAEPVTAGMTLLQYAAIKLRVPESGDDWLDSMILESLRNEIAAKAMQGIVSTLHQGIRPTDIQAMCGDAYAIADAMLKVSEQ